MIASADAVVEFSILIVQLNVSTVVCPCSWCDVHCNDSHAEGSGLSRTTDYCVQSLVCKLLPSARFVDEGSRE